MKTERVKEDVIDSAGLVLDLNYKLFPFLWFIGVVFTLVETFTYQGFIKRYLFLDIKIIFIATLLSGAYVVLSSLSCPKKYKFDAEIFRLIKNLSLLATPVMMLFSFLLYGQLLPNRNSVVFGDAVLVYPGRFILATLLIIYFLSIYLAVDRFDKYILHLFSKNAEDFRTAILRISFFVIFCWIFLSSAGKNFKLFRFNVSRFISEPGASYEEKMIDQIGPIYKYYQFINENTPEDAVILNPKQQGQWPDVSNQGYTRYFIYPRNLVSEELLESSRDRITHVFLIGDRKLHDQKPQNRWPDFYVPAKRIIFFPNDDVNEPIIVNDSYDPDGAKHPGYWGIVEVEKGVPW